MALPQFKNEKEFREKWISPFLTKMGFIRVTLYHGGHEQGKDHFFADLDRFENLRFYAVQAKKGNIGSGTKELENLIRQVRRCFDVTIKYGDIAHNQRVSGVYVMASGTISHDACEEIADTFRGEHYGQNVYFLGGERLELLDRGANRAVDKEQRQLLEALFHECRFNLTAITAINESCNTYRYSPLRLTNGAVGNCLYYSAMGLLSKDDLMAALHNYRVVNGTLDMICNNPAVNLDGLRSEMLEHCFTAAQTIGSLLESVRAALSRLDEWQKISIEVDHPVNPTPPKRQRKK